MTEERLSEIESRLAACSPWPWSPEGIPYDRVTDPVICDRNDFYVAQTVYDMQSVTIRPQVEADTLLIAHAPQDLAELVAEVRRLQAEVECHERAWETNAL